MLFIKKVIVPETRRALLFKNEQFSDLLMPGVHKIVDWKKQYRILLVDITDTLVEGVNEQVSKCIKTSS